MTVSLGPWVMRNRAVKAPIAPKIPTSTQVHVFYDCPRQETFQGCFPLGYSASYYPRAIEPSECVERISLYPTMEAEYRQMGQLPAM